MYQLLTKNSALLNTTAFPLVSDYSEYDFKNKQALDALEDAFWEVSNPTPLYEEYILSKLKRANPTYLNTEKALFTAVTRDLLAKTTLFLRPLSLDNRAAPQPYTYSKSF
jgi:hypothetical protein